MPTIVLLKLMPMYIWEGQPRKAGHSNYTNLIKKNPHSLNCNPLSLNCNPISLNCNPLSLNCNPLSLN